IHLNYHNPNPTSTTDTNTLSLHDALPICKPKTDGQKPPNAKLASRKTDVENRPHRNLKQQQHYERRIHTRLPIVRRAHRVRSARSEEHTSELQSPDHLVCRLLLEKKKKQT